MSALDRYTDEELVRMIRAADRACAYAERVQVTALDSFCSWLGAVGLGWIAATITTAEWAWGRIRSLWRVIFG
jgi:hypothetical protein